MQPHDRRKRNPRFEVPGRAVVFGILVLAALVSVWGSRTRRPAHAKLSLPARTAPLVPTLSPKPPPVRPVEKSPTPDSGCPQGCSLPKPGCEIKGNISYRIGEKIYHLPGQEYYNRTVISPDYGERWFCTELEARANGWRKSKR